MQNFAKLRASSAEQFYIAVLHTRYNQPRDEVAGLVVVMLLGEQGTNAAFTYPKKWKIVPNTRRKAILEGGVLKGTMTDKIVEATK